MLNKIILKTKKDTVLFAEEFAKSLQSSNPPTPLVRGASANSPLTRGGRGVAVIALTGELGVGKTFFTKALGKALGVKETIKSPSFNLMKIYEIPSRDAPSLSSSSPKRGLGTTQSNIQQHKIKTLVHVDCYRLNSAEELVDIGLLDYFGYNNTLIVIEWADKIKKILPKDTIWVKFEMKKNDVRTVVVN